MNLEEIQENDAVIGADGSEVGTIDFVGADRIVIVHNDTDTGPYSDLPHHIPAGLVAETEDGTVKLYPNPIAVMMAL